MVYQQYDDQQQTTITMFPSDCLHRQQTQQQHQSQQQIAQQRLGGTPYNVSTTRSATAGQHSYYTGYLPTAEAAGDDMVTARPAYVHADVAVRQLAPAPYYHQRAEYPADQSPTSGMHQSWIPLYPTATGVDLSEQPSAGREHLRQEWRSGGDPSRYAGSAGSSLYGETEQLMVMLSPSHHSSHGNLVTSVAGNGAADRSPLGADNPCVTGNYAYPHSVTDLHTLAASPTSLGPNVDLNKYQSQQQQQQHHHHRSVSAAGASDGTLRDSGGPSDARNSMSASSQQQQTKSAVRNRLYNAVGESLRSPAHGTMGTGQGWSHSPQVAQHQHPPAPFDWMKKQTYPAVTPSGKTRTKDKYRIVYTELQKVELEKEFLYNQYITIQRKAELAGHIGLSDRQVKIWFQNRRAKERKHKRKREENTSLRTSTSSSSGGLSANGSSLSSAGAPAQMGGGSKSAPVMDPAPRLHQLQQQQQHRCSDVIKKESGHEMMASSIAQSNLYTSIN